MSLENAVELIFGVQNRDVRQTYGSLEINIFRDAVKKGNLPLTKWLVNNGHNWQCYSIDEATFWGQLEIIKYLHIVKLKECSTKASAWVARNCCIDILKWLHVHRKEGFNGQALYLAIEHGHLDIFKWLQMNNIDGCDSYAKSLASVHDQPYIVHWLERGRD